MPRKKKRPDKRWHQKGFPRGCQEKEMPRKKKRPDKDVARERVARREDVKRKRRQWI